MALVTQPIRKRPDPLRHLCLRPGHRYRLDKDMPRPVPLMPATDQVDVEAALARVRFFRPGAVLEIKGVKVTTGKMIWYRVPGGWVKSTALIGMLLREVG